MQPYLLLLLLTELTSTVAAPRGTREILEWNLYVLALFSNPKRGIPSCSILASFPNLLLLAILPCFSTRDRKLGGGRGMRLDLSMELYIYKEASFMLQKIVYVLLSHTHRWAMAEGYGAHLIKHPELIADMVTQASSRSGLPVSIKIRIHNDLRSVGVVKKT